MEIFDNFLLGLSVASTPVNLLYCLIGVFVGTLIGVLPGIGPVPAIAMLLPITFGLSPATALIMLAGIYYGASYGGSTTAILVNLPGESSSVVTCIEGYQMARQGRAGVALGISAIGSFIAGCVATVVIALFAPPLTSFALKFGAAEYFSLMVVGLIAAAVLASGDLLKGIAMIALGLLLGLVGNDVHTGVPRFTFGQTNLSDGIGFVLVATGVFAFAEIAANLERPQQRTTLTTSVRSLLPSLADFAASWKAIARGTAIGSVLGVLPGGGAMLSSFASYAVEKRVARDPSRFGKGAIEGVAGPESANNAGAQTSFIPLLTLGIPSNAVMALMVGAMMIQGITPGPNVINERPEMLWGVVASMWVGNLMLIVLNLPLIGIWIRLLTMPYRYLYPAIVVFCCIGVYSVSNSSFDILMAGGFGVLGYIFLKLGCEAAPLLLGFVIGPMMEEHLRRALVLAHGDFTVFLRRPISLALLLAAAGLLLIMILPAIRRQRQEVFQE